jgi:hypothetical protein
MQEGVAHQTNSRIPAAYPCLQVQDDEFIGYDTDTAIHFVMFARLI